MPTIVEPTGDQSPEARKSEADYERAVRLAGAAISLIECRELVIPGGSTTRDVLVQILMNSAAKRKQSQHVTAENLADAILGTTG